LLRAVGGREEACRRFCQVRLTFGDNPFGGIACWGGAQAWVETHVPDVYRRGYLATVLPELRATRGGGVSLRAVKLVALVMAQAAEHGTGRGSRLTVAIIKARTGLGESTVQRARTALRLLGVATEVFRGRLRTYAERMASWRVGDRARGWASVWALHPPTPVDRTRIAVGVVLGCTEIELLISDTDSPVPIFPTTRLHVEAAVDASLAARRSRGAFP